LIFFGYRRKKTQYSKSFRDVYRMYNEMRDISDTQIMKKHLVVGMTTTGAARLQTTIQVFLVPKCVISIE